MILALLLASIDPAPMTAIDAERAFAADAQKVGQWTAFRQWSTPDAMMFVPQPVKAHDFLKVRKDPPVSVYWWPGRSYVSCDGTVAVNTGPWVRGYGQSVGYFTTVWVRQADGGWKWVYDAGEELKVARSEGGDIHAKTASCEGKPVEAITFAASDDRGSQAQSGRSKDGTLSWSWTFDSKTHRQFMVQLWDGTRFQNVLNDIAVTK